MQNILGMESDRATMEMMMRHYRDELLRYQRATAPGKPTLTEETERFLQQPQAEAESEALPPADEPTQSESEQECEIPAEQAELTLPVESAENEPTEDFISPPILPQIVGWEDRHTEFEKCVGAYGEFRPYERMGKYTMASFLQVPGSVTPVLARFSADVALGGADHSRCRRALTVKFFCEDGEYDMPAEHLAVTAGVGEQLQAECSLTTRADPISGIRSPDSFWRFLLKYNEALPMALWLYSDLGTIESYRAMDSCSPPCIWVNKRGEKRYVRMMWLSRKRPRTLNRFEAEEMAGFDPDSMSRDLINAISSGEKVQYELAVQIIEPDAAKEMQFDPLDPTEIWSKESFAVERIGLLTLTEPVKNAAAELSAEKFRGENIISGIEYPELQVGSGIKIANRQLKLMGEFERRTIARNIAEQLKTVSPDIMEQVLILLTEADLQFGQAVTDAVGGGGSCE